MRDCLIMITFILSETNVESDETKIHKISRFCESLSIVYLMIVVHLLVSFNTIGIIIKHLFRM